MRRPRKRYGKNITAKPRPTDLPDGVCLIGPRPEQLVPDARRDKRPAKHVREAEDARAGLRLAMADADGPLLETLTVAYEQWDDVLTHHRSLCAAGPGKGRSAKLNADERLSRAIWAGEADRRATTQRRKLIDDVLPEMARDLGVSVASLRAWRRDAATAEERQIRLAYRAARRHGARIFNII